MTHLVTQSSAGENIQLTPDALKQAMEANPALVDAVLTLVKEAELMGLPPRRCDQVERRPNKRARLNRRGHPTAWDVMVWEPVQSNGGRFGHAYCEKVDLPTAQTVQNVAQVVLELRKAASQ